MSLLSQLFAPHVLSSRGSTITVFEFLFFLSSVGFKPTTSGTRPSCSNHYTMGLLMKRKKLGYISFFNYVYIT